MGQIGNRTKDAFVKDISHSTGYNFSCGTSYNSFLIFRFSQNQMIFKMFFFSLFQEDTKSGKTGEKKRWIHDPTSKYLVIDFAMELK